MNQVKERARIHRHTRQSIRVEPNARFHVKNGQNKDVVVEETPKNAQHIDKWWKMWKDTRMKREETNKLTENKNIRTFFRCYMLYVPFILGLVLFRYSLFLYLTLSLSITHILTHCLTKWQHQFRILPRENTHTQSTPLTIMMCWHTDLITKYALKFWPQIWVNVFFSVKAVSLFFSLFITSQSKRMHTFLKCLLQLSLSSLFLCHLRRIAFVW